MHDGCLMRAITISTVVFYMRVTELGPYSRDAWQEEALLVSIPRYFLLVSSSARAALGGTVSVGVAFRRVGRARSR
jgi:hypothetical protein